MQRPFGPSTPILVETLSRPLLRRGDHAASSDAFEMGLMPNYAPRLLVRDDGGGAGLLVGSGPGCA
jgi:hypothetical protein